MMKPRPWLLLLLAVCVLGGCQRSKIGWLQGKWVFDEQYTALKHSELKPPEGMAALGELLVSPLLEGMKGGHLAFTEKDVVTTTRDGNGTAEHYEILPPAEKDAVTLKEGGKVWTYHQENDRLWFSAQGNVQLRIYFKREQ